MHPTRRPDGKPTLDRARTPTEIDVLTPRGLAVVEPPRHGAWDVDADEALQQASRGPRTAVRRTAAAGTMTKAQRRAAKLTQVALALRVEGWSIADIADRLAVSAATVTGWFSTHRRHVAADHLDALLDEIAVPLATENLIHGLIAGDKDYTLETLKGRGQLKRHTEGDGKPQTTLPALSIVFEAREPSAAIASAGSMIAGGRVFGTAAMPKAIEGQVIDVTDSEPPRAAAGPRVEGEPAAPAADPDA